MQATLMFVSFTLLVDFMFLNQEKIIMTLHEMWKAL